MHVSESVLNQRAVVSQRRYWQGGTLTGALGAAGGVSRSLPKQQGSDDIPEELSVYDEQERASNRERTVKHGVGIYIARLLCTTI
jgi:hypothetical protein